MSVVAKVGRAYDCFERFRGSCDKKFKMLVDLFFPMFYDEENNCKLTINVDQLSLTFDKIMVKPGYYNNDPQLIFEDRSGRIPRPITMFNLNAIKELEIKLYIENGHDIYRISFKYIDGQYYRIHILLT